MIDFLFVGVLITVAVARAVQLSNPVGLMSIRAIDHLDGRAHEAVGIVGRSLQATDWND
jgi:hypothetical protein